MSYIYFVMSVDNSLWISTPRGTVPGVALLRTKVVYQAADQCPTNQNDIYMLPTLSTLTDLTCLKFHPAAQQPSRQSPRPRNWLSPEPEIEPAGPRWVGLEIGDGQDGD
jgi:hypothetical protein